MIEITRDPAGPFQNKILLVDDEAPIRLLMWSILDRAGYEVHVACDGFDALRKISEIGAFDLLVTDLSMPGMTGIELARRTLENNPEMAVVYATGSQECFPETRADITCVTKPFTIDELITAVRTALNQRKPRVELHECDSIGM